ncbi:Sec63-domain-containing protein [Dentipellis sp. KUC8613]|nr:Sec63-domain-containing protein [Dentipellis sp. KUC8613]
MTDLLAHVRSLVGTSGEHSEDRHAVDLWNSFSFSGQETPIEDAIVEDEWADHDSVLDVYRTPSIPASQSGPGTLVSRLLSKPHVPLDALSALLSSTQPSESISEELTDMIGFDDMDLVFEILAERSSVAKDLGLAIQNGNSGTGREVNGGSQSYAIDPDDARRRMEEQFRATAARPLFTAEQQAAPEYFPHVYSSSSMVQGNVLSQFGSKYMLPLGTSREMKETYEEVVIPPSKPVPPRATERLINVAELDPLARGAFPSYKTLNRIQSIIYPTAYGSNENILVCAPTGAGKTDVAMLTVLRVLDQHRSSSSSSSQSIASTIRRDDFKIVYVAPMKALAAEIVRKLGKRLQWLNIRVRELTGDMQLTKAEIAETQIIVTTPEKWDVVTRKPTGEGEIASKVKLLIIDEVHLLNEERGAVIETIVARTLRQVEYTQSVIRIVGLSATLPNYVDVADFLSVSHQTGLFYFDSSFRPVPLEQHFIGVKGKPNSPTSRKNLDQVTYDKVVELVQQGHQVMVFVHARKETVKAAQALREAALAEGTLDDFSCQEHPSFSFFRQDIGRSRNKEMKQLFDDGFGIHHAGMLRSDRNMMEKMFDARAIKVLCCTATLAWGVNLPAHAVIIKGTQVYDSSKGSFVDLSVLDVLQVFGRAGRPGLEDSGEGYICTTDDKLTHYLDAVMSQNPIESQFKSGMIDSLNAEISLGTVSNVAEATQWLGYTYLYVRMRKNPFVYGMSRDEPAKDPNLVDTRRTLIKNAARQLEKARMVNMTGPDGDILSVTDLGRIAAKYYIRHASIEKFNELFRPRMTEADVLTMLSWSTEFDQIQIRETETEELKQLIDIIPCEVKGVDTSQDKVNILLQGSISRYFPEDFALVSDMAYVAQNAGRIIRALLEIAISRKWADVSAVLMGLSKAIEKRLWPFDQPLKQFELKQDVFYGLERWADNYPVAELASMTAAELGKLVHLNERHGQAILDAAKQFPTVEIQYELKPLGSDVLKIAVKVIRSFNWNSRLHGSVEPFWLWVEDHEGTSILQMSHLLFRQTTDVLHVDFIIAIPPSQPPPSVTIRFVSDRWLGAENEVAVSLESLIMPTYSNSHIPRLDLPFLDLSVLRNPLLEQLLSSRLSSLNAIQTQVFWSTFRTKGHGLICAPTGCGKSTLGQLLAWDTLSQCPDDSYVLVVASRRTLAMEWVADMASISEALGFAVNFATGRDVFRQIRGKAVRITTPVHLLAGLMERKPFSPLPGLQLVICENLEQMDARHELGVSLLRHATQLQATRFVGLANSLNDSADLAAWLDVEPSCLHSFRPSARDQQLTLTAQTFTIPQTAALFKAMAKPAHAAIRASSDGTAIVFIPSRGQCRLIALDLITHCTLEMSTERGYLPPEIAPDYLESYVARLEDRSLVDFIDKGVGFFHDGLSRTDRSIMLQLYAEGTIRVLLVPRDACWTLPVRAATVVVMGTQYIHVEAGGGERQVRDYALSELVRMQGRAVRHNGSGHFHLFCQAEDKDTYMRFLEEGLPLESELQDSDVLRQWYRRERRSGVIKSKLEAAQALAFTFLARRLVSNPVYYGAQHTRDESLSRVVDTLEEFVAQEEATTSKGSGGPSEDSTR